MTFLRLLSEEVSQNFTYTCINSVAWYDLRSYNYDNALRLMGDNEQEFSTRSYRPTVLHDGCKVGRIP